MQELAAAARSTRAARDTPAELQCAIQFSAVTRNEFADLAQRHTAGSEASCEPALERFCSNPPSVQLWPLALPWRATRRPFNFFSSNRRG